MEVTLIDSPVANVANIARALRQAGADLRVTRDAEVIAVADKIVLPGVGSFASAINCFSTFRTRWERRRALVCFAAKCGDSRVRSPCRRSDGIGCGQPGAAVLHCSKGLRTARPFISSTPMP